MSRKIREKFSVIIQPIAGLLLVDGEKNNNGSPQVGDRATAKTCRLVTTGTKNKSAELNGGT